MADLSLFQNSKNPESLPKDWGDPLILERMKGLNTLNLLLTKKTTS